MVNSSQAALLQAIVDNPRTLQDVREAVAAALSSFTSQPSTGTTSMTNWLCCGHCGTNDNASHSAGCPNGPCYECGRAGSLDFDAAPPAANDDALALVYEARAQVSQCGVGPIARPIITGLCNALEAVLQSLANGAPAAATADAPSSRPQQETADV